MLASSATEIVEGTASVEETELASSPDFPTRASGVPFLNLCNTEAALNSTAVSLASIAPVSGLLPDALAGSSERLGWCTGGPEPAGGRTELG
jgi:hypothetical protein